MLSALLWIWQFPQHLIALALIRLWNARYDNGPLVQGVWWITRPGIGVCLGEYIILCDGSTETDIKHEQGHRQQSRMLGPLYLFVVGIASAVFNNLWDRAFHKSWTPEARGKWYYSRYPEAWADQLGGVRRGNL